MKLERATLPTLFSLLIVARSAAAGPARCSAVDLFRDDFSRYPAGWLSKPLGTLNGAVQEYHYLPDRGVPLGPWANAICYQDAWLVSDEDGKPYLEQHLINDLPQIMNPLFVTGDAEWADYTVEARVRPLSLASWAGIAFRYATNRHYYLFALGGGKEAFLTVRLPLESGYRVAQWRELGRVPFPYDSRRYYQLRVENEGKTIRAFIDGKKVLEVSDGELLKGKAGLAAQIPTRYQDFRVSACPPARDAAQARIAAREGELTRLRAEYPAPRLWKKFRTAGFGAGRNVRFGDLDGDGKLDMLIAQNIPHVQADAFSQISALTAVTLDGKVLWQIGHPDPRNGLLTNDSPFQIQDVDGDGHNEVVMVRDFKLQVLDGRTGKVKRWVWMPPMPDNAKVKPYQLYSGDSIVFANLTGKPGRRDMLLKDRYRHFWGYSRDLKPLFAGEEETGHYPFPLDVDGDGKDELFIGHGMYDHTGKRRWSYDGKLLDHVDAVSVGSFGVDPKAPPRVYWSSSDEGFVMLDLAGNILKHVRVGHTQNAAVGKFRDLPGLQYMTINFWRNPGIITLFDADGNILGQDEPVHHGSSTLPVNWRGDGQELVLLSGSAREGGMIDGQFRRVVMFPADGHPEMAAAVLDLTGDARDEVVLWNPDEVWIYTQDRPAPAGRLYAPVRTPLYNDSNYRASISLPRWVETR